MSVNLRQGSKMNANAEQIVQDAIQSDRRSQNIIQTNIREQQMEKERTFTHDLRDDITNQRYADKVESQGAQSSENFQDLSKQNSKERSEDIDSQERHRKQGLWERTKDVFSVAANKVTKFFKY